MELAIWGRDLAEVWAAARAVAWLVGHWDQTSALVPNVDIRSHTISVVCLVHKSNVLNAAL